MYGCTNVYDVCTEFGQNSNKHYVTESSFQLSVIQPKLNNLLTNETNLPNQTSSNYGQTQPVVKTKTKAISLLLSTLD